MFDIPKTVALPMWVPVLGAFTILVLGVILWSVKRRRRPQLKLSASSSGDSAELLPSIAGLTQSTFVGGNKIELVQNGQYFDRLFADLEKAKATITIETFLSKKGQMTNRLTDILVRKAGQGVKVRMMLDGSGGRDYGKEDWKRLHDAGIEARKFHPVRFSNLGLLNNRTHRKITVIDGCVGYVGGHCFVDTWMGNAEDKKHFRDITARVSGPVVRQLQSAFTDNWVEETSEVIGGKEFFPEIEETGQSQAMIAFVSPIGGPSTLKLLHYLAITTACKTLTIQNPYFLPDPDAQKALMEAVKRGVVVRVMIPDEKASDSPLVQHASHHHYGTMLKGGVRIFDYQPTLLHQKVLTVDGEWSLVGSCNFDDRSFEINDEVSMVVVDRDLARELEETFARDLENAQERNLEDWKRRPVLHKLKDGLAFMVNEQL